MTDKPFSLLIKPAGADCNLRCYYCFYLEKSALYPETRRHRMTPEVLAATIASYMATPQQCYAFGWQGGEPALMGAAFFRQATDLQQLHGRPGAVVSNGLQTNATLLDDDMARHFARYRFLLGVSLDGPPAVHDLYRRTGSARPTHARVLRAIAALRRHAVEFNILTLVSQANVARGAQVYRYLRDQGHFFHQYIPCVEFDSRGDSLPFAISGEEWGEFLCDVFDAWSPDDRRRVSVRLFDSILACLVDGTRNVCTMQSDCRQYFVVEYNGDVYPCDFFVEPALRLGNVLSHSWRQMLESPAYAAFGARKAAVSAACAACTFLDLCMGDCPRHRPPAQADSPAPSALCAGWKRFYAHALPRLADLADDVRRERSCSPRQP